MNWRVTRKDHKVLFKAGDPIARILPYPIALLNETNMEIVELTSDPGFLDEVNQWGQARAKNVQKAQTDIAAWLDGGDKPEGEGYGIANMFALNRVERRVMRDIKPCFDHKLRKIKDRSYI